MRCDCQLPAKICQHSPNLAPTWLQLGPTWLQLGPTWPQLGPNLEPTWRKLAPNWPQLGPTWPNLAPTCPNLVPTWPQQGPTWPNRAQLGSKLVPKLINLAPIWLNLVYLGSPQVRPTWPQLASQFVTTWHQLAYNRHHHPTHIGMKRVGLFHGLHKRHTVRKACWPLQWTTQAQRSLQRGGGAGDSPRGRLRSGAPEGVQLC